MPIYIVKGDITKIKVDAIVNAANSSLLGGGGVDGAIHRAAGAELLQECRTLGGCETGGAKITKGYNLPAKYVIHTVGPVWRGGKQGEEELLKSCYCKSISLAKQNKCESIAFPLISSGIYGYPKDKAFEVAYESIKANIDGDMIAYLVIFDGQREVVGGEYLAQVDRYVEDREARGIILEEERARNYDASYSLNKKSKDYFSLEPRRMEYFSASEIFERIKLDESFSKTLLRLIDERGYTDSQCYKKANVDRKHFSKIRSDDNYHPSKSTAVAFAIALELNLEETGELLRKAGYALTRSSVADIIIEYCISNKIYDIYEINRILFAYDQRLLGC